MTRPRQDGAAGRPHFGPMPSLAAEITDFEHDVLERSHERAVLAEFWAPWSATCAKLRPVLERIVRKHAGHIELKSVNIEMHPEILEEQGVQGLPLVKAYLQGRALGELTGVPEEAKIEEWVDTLFTAAEAAGLAMPAAPAPAPIKPPRA